MLMKAKVGHHEIEGIFLIDDFQFKKKQNKKTDEGDIGHNTSARQPTRKETLAGFPGVS